MGLASYVDFRVGDVLQILRELTGPFDFVLLDVWKDIYVQCFDLFQSKLSVGAIVVADNMTFPSPSANKPKPIAGACVRVAVSIRCCCRSAVASK